MSHGLILVTDCALQAVEEEQERFGDRQQQQQKDIQRLQAASQQLEQEQQQSRRTTEGDSGVCAQAPAAAPLNAASALMQRTVSGRQRVAAAPLSAAAVAEHAHTDGGVVCNLPQGFSLPEMGCMLPSSFSEPDQAQSSRDLATYQPTPSSLGKPSSGQQQPRDVRASDTMPADGEHSGASVSQLLSESRSSRAQLFSAAGLVDRVCALEEQQQETEELVARLEVLEELQQQQAEELAARLQALEDLSAGAVPLDAMTCGAVEARLSVLEDDNSEHKQQLQVCVDGYMMLDGQRCCSPLKAPGQQCVCGRSHSRPVSGCLHEPTAGRNSLQSTVGPVETAPLPSKPDRLPFSLTAGSPSPASQAMRRVGSCPTAAGKQRGTAQIARRAAAAVHRPDGRH